MLNFSGFIQSPEAARLRNMPSNLQGKNQREEPNSQKQWLNNFYSQAYLRF
jgi:hypothetical protein